MVLDRAEMLRQVWARWSEELDGLDASGWSSQTRCEGWTVRTLVAHTGDGILGFHTALDGRMVDREADVFSAAELMARLKPDQDSAQLMADKADERALRSSEQDTEHLTAPFHASADAMLRLVRARPDGVVDYFGRADVTVPALVELALLEGTVHYLDLVDALGKPANISDDVMQEVLRTLVSMSPPKALIEAATGRRHPGDVFPVHF